MHNGELVSQIHSQYTEGEKDGIDVRCNERSIFYRKVTTETQTRCEHQRFRKLILFLVN